MRLRFVATLAPPVPGLGRSNAGKVVSFLPLDRIWADSRFDPSHTIELSGDVESYNPVREGDLLVPKVSPTFAHGRTAIASGLTGGRALATSEVFVLRPDDPRDASFLRYRLISPDFLREGQSAWHGVAGLKRVSGDFLMSTRIATQAWRDRHVIAGFLDRECGRLEAARSREAELTDRLSRVPAQLFEADHHVRTAERVRFRFSLRAVEQGWSPQCEARLAERGGWGVTKTGAANYGHFRPDEHKALPIDLRPLPEYELRVGDVVMSRANTRELAGSAARVRELGGWRLLMCDKLYRLGVRDQVLDPDFAVLAINSREARRQIEASTSGASASMQNISQDVVRGLRLPRPSLADQRAIVARVNAASRDVARSMSIASELRAALTAYRDSLIHEAVTGKLDVTKASDRQMDERLHAAAEGRLDEVPV